MSNEQARSILVIDDESQIRRFLRISLSHHGYRILEAADAASGLALCASEQPDLLILDLGLPDMDGHAVVEEVRRWSDVPILVLSVRAEESQKVKALDQGADDYVTKPFGMAELIARVRVLLRPSRRGEKPGQPVYRVGDLTVDLPAHRVTLGGQEIRLSPKEFSLLAELMAHAGRVLTHRHLLNHVWGPAHEHDVQYLRVYIAQLRQKLNDDPASPRIIINEPGIGYRLLSDS